MNYADLFPKPITECTDEEIIARAMELREKNALPKFSSIGKAPKLAKEKVAKTPVLSKAELAMQSILESAMAKKAAKDSTNEKEDSSNPSTDLPS